jgi:hypothetical protein
MSKLIRVTLAVMVLSICGLVILNLSERPAGVSSGFFKRDGNGVITDSRTNLQWLEGPNRPINWDETRAWIKTLGEGWRSPTVKELRGIVVSTNRVGGNTTSWLKLLSPWAREKDGTGPFPLHLDPAFKLEMAYEVWAEPKDPSSAWMFLFDVCREYFAKRDHSSWMLRGFAVRSRK